jgi:hypothetical protein
MCLHGTEGETKILVLDIIRCTKRLNPAALKTLSESGGEYNERIFRIL